MSTRNLITERIILPISDLILRQTVSKHFRFLMESQYWSRDQIESYQNERLRKLINHAYYNVPYYQELFNKISLSPNDIQTKEDLVKLPITSKSDLKRYPHKHLANNIKNKELLYRSSSGSTGEPFQFYKTKHSESFLTASAIRGWYWNGYRLGDKYVKVSMNPRNSSLKKLQDRINNCLYLSAQQLTTDVFDKIIIRIIEFNPKFIRCYPVPLLLLSERIKSSIKVYPANEIEGINTTGSSLKVEVRSKVEEIFQSKIFDAYSCEGGADFFECPEKQNYHPSEEYAISEFLADSFTISHADKPLRHITTDLHNFATPFIRYDTQDYIVLNPREKCGCGRDFLNVRNILGRDSDIIITPSGKFLIVENFVAYFEWIQEVDQIQIVQTDLNKIIIKLIVSDQFNDKILKTITAYWQEYIGEDVNIIVEIVDELELTPSGKRRTVIRNPNIPING